MPDLSAALTGLANGINGYMQTNNANSAKMQQDAYQSQLDTQKTLTTQTAQQQNELDKGKALEQNKLDIAGKVTPDMAESLIPGSSKWVQDFQTTNKRLPTVDEAKDGMQAALLKLTAGDDKEQKRQDMLEKHFQDQQISVRGDQSLARTEKQRDAAGLAYDTIAKVKSEGRDMTELEQTDVLAQLYQARTGKTPTDQDMAAIKEKTAKAGFNHAVTYFTGNPTLVGSSTKATMDNILQFVDATGTKADQQNEAYMSTRRSPPTGLAKERADHVLSVTRGLSYADQKGVSDKTYSAARKPKASSGWSYIGPVK